MDKCIKGCLENTAQGTINSKTPYLHCVNSHHLIWVYGLEMAEWVRTLATGTRRHKWPHRSVIPTLGVRGAQKNPLGLLPTSLAPTWRAPGSGKDLCQGHHVATDRGGHLPSGLCTPIRTHTHRQMHMCTYAHSTTHIKYKHSGL